MRGHIDILYEGSGLDVSVSLDVPDCKYVHGGPLVRNGRWTFFKSWHVSGSNELSELSLYREAIYLVSQQLTKWLIVICKAIEYEKQI